MSTSDTILRVEDLKKTYRKGIFKKSGFQAIRGVSLEVGRGQVFGLLGPNGAGKTTLIKVLLGLVRRFEGHAELFGQPPDHPGSRRRVGYLPEAHRLPGYLTGRQVMELFGQLAGKSPPELASQIDPLLERVGMRNNANRKVREYSKGMQQRIGLAQALTHKPELVFLDEPTDGVDPVGRATIREMIQDLKNEGVSIFINSHLLMEVEKTCDRVVIMNHGRIIREGTVDELTPHTGAVRFDLVDPVEIETLHELLRGVGEKLLPQGERAFEIQVDPEQLNAVIDRLRDKGLRIRSIGQPRMTLEQSFIDLVQKESA